MNDDIHNFGGMLTYICIWSGHASAFIISTSFLLHSSLNINPISCLSFPYISFLLYFSANTIWYLHSHVVCAKLSVYGLFIRPTPLIINILSRQTFNIISCLEWVFLLLCSTLKAFRYH